MGGSGVQRPLKFAKYLKEYGWNPIILCPEPGAYHTFDDSLDEELNNLELELHRVKASTPFHFLAGKRTKKELSISDSKTRFFRKISKLVFYPDNKKGWIEPAIKKGVEIIEKKDVRLIFSTAPPFSNHIIGRDLKKRTNLPLVLDYRDSWTQNHFMTDLSGWQRRIMERMEASCLKEANGVVGLDDFMLYQMKLQNSDKKTKFEVIPHGFDPEDFENDESTSFSKKKGKLNILYSGLFYEANQPDLFLQAIKKIFEEHPEWVHSIHLHFQGGLDKRITTFIQKLGLSNHVSDYGYVNHKLAVQNIQKADLLWMISNFSPELKQIKSGKLFEYFGTGKPVLGLIHEGVAAELLDQYGAGFRANPDSLKAISAQIEAIMKLWESDSLPKANDEFVQKFDRRKLTKELASFFDVISS